MPHRRILRAFDRNREQLLPEWLNELHSNSSYRQDMLSERELSQQAGQFLDAFHDGVASGVLDDIEHEAWDAMRELLARMLRSWAGLGFKTSQVAAFILLLKRPLFVHLAEGDSDQELVEDLWRVSVLLDRLALWMTEFFQTELAETIQRQQMELLELSTPVVTLWDGVLALPLIGTLDSARTQVVMESLLTKIVEHEADVAILDITGVPTVDTMVAQHLLKTVTAARLMGAECIISGIRPTIAQTMVQLGVDLHEVTTKATLADAFHVALRLRGLRVKAADGQPGA